MMAVSNHSASVSLRHDLRPGDVGYITYLHGTLYAQDQGWDHTFDAYVATPLAEFARSQSSRERIWILEKDGRIVGSAAVVRFSDREAQLRWLLMDPSVRGQGLGRWLAEEALEFCRTAGYFSVFLWTVKTLTIATKLYQSLGFREIQEQTHELWGSIVTEVRYDLDLNQ
jgi:GNAT superfamily N-acetyltransferase